MELERAFKELCDVTGMAPEWTKLGKLQEQVHSHWSKIKRKYDQGRFGLDEVGRRNMGRSASPPQF